jgi:MarR family transcriptional regulator, organic hydroperoxide resistance regulator
VQLLSIQFITDDPHRGTVLAQRPTLDLDEYFPYLINRVGTALAASFGDSALGPDRLSIAMWRALAALSDNGGQRLVDLSAMTSIDVSTLSRMVSRLARLGLVTRMRSRKSDREIVVTLTPKGRTMLTRLIPMALRFEQVAIARISLDDLVVAKRVLRQMHENMAGLAALFAPPRARRR